MEYVTDIQWMIAASSDNGSCFLPEVTMRISCLVPARVYTPLHPLAGARRPGGVGPAAHGWDSNGVPCLELRPFRFVASIKMVRATSVHPSLSLSISPVSTHQERMAEEKSTMKAIQYRSYGGGAGALKVSRLPIRYEFHSPPDAMGFIPPPPS